ncbi:sialomucin core protein 24-like isoform X2 [Hoplias malabaricus]|uniref:sialomucin core protein 24-like isoform X2 n=1 Tax=Hoplias malabaricus TaxID=27720 RepID=UPI003461FD43
MEKLHHIFMLIVLLITISWALPNITTSPITSGPSRYSTTGNTEESYTSNLSSNSSAQNTAPTDNMGNSTIHNSTYSTPSYTKTNSTLPSPTDQTKITKVQTTQSATDTTATHLTTQPVSESTITSVSTTSATLSSPTFTGHGNNESTSDSTTAYLTTEMAPGNKTSNETAGTGLNFSETSMTILFSVVLGVIVLIVLGQIVYKVSRSKHRMVQYSHRPLYNEDAGEPFAVPDDTLVISGGLYDGPQIYNPTVTTLNDEDQHTFAYAPTQLRLEFLHEEHGTDREDEVITFETFRTTDPKP